MKKEILLILSLVVIILLIGIYWSTLYINDQSKEPDEHTNEPVSPEPDIIIPQHYPKIQDGIDRAKPGNIILVKSGTYKENIVINKEDITLIGENKENTVIDGGKLSKHAVNISAPGVTFKGFTVTNGWSDNVALWDISGIFISASDVTIDGNIIDSNLLGMTVLDVAHGLTITNNSFYDDSILLGNWEYYNKLTEESYLHVIENNMVNGKPLYYFKNVEDYVVPSDAGQVILAGCNKVTIDGNKFDHADFPILLGFCTNCVVENIVIEDSYGEIILLESNNCIIQDNKMSNMIHGVCLDQRSMDNIVRGNVVTDSFFGISSYSGSTGNQIYDNEVHDNGVGILVYDHAYGNTVSENVIHDNKCGVQIMKSCYENVIERNNITKNLIGLQLKDSSDGNFISYNIFKRNIFSGTFTDCGKNIWEHNYWGRPHILPKSIYGVKMLGKIPILKLNFDKTPLFLPS